MASEAVKGLVERLDVIKYRPSKLVKHVMSKINSRGGSLSNSKGMKEYEELNLLVKQRLDAGNEAFESVKSVLRFFFAYIEQYSEQHGAENLLDVKSKLLLKAILNHIVVETKKNILKEKLFKLSSALNANSALKSNRSTAAEPSWSGWFGFTEDAEIDLMPPHVREALKAFIESLDEMPEAGAGGGATVLPIRDIFEYPRGVVRHMVPFPGLREGNLVTEPRVALVGHAKALYDSISIEGLLHSARMGSIFGTATGHPSVEAIMERNEQIAPMRAYSDAADRMSAQFEKFTREKSKPSMALSSRFLLENGSRVPNMRARSRSRNRNSNGSSQTLSRSNGRTRNRGRGGRGSGGGGGGGGSGGGGGASGVGFGRGGRRSSRRKTSRR